MLFIVKYGISYWSFILIIHSVGANVYVVSWCFQLDILGEQNSYKTENKEITVSNWSSKIVRVRRVKVVNEISFHSIAEQKIRLVN